MLENPLLKTNFLGNDGYKWWIGQIVEETNWAPNMSEKPLEKVKDFKGFDYRYKVRILGYHTDDRNDLPDKDLPWASVLLPVTAGSGQGGASQSPNLRQGNFVFGFFMDGDDAQQPVITGVFGINQYAKVARNDQVNSFVNLSGYSKFYDEKVPRWAETLFQNQETTDDPRMDVFNNNEVVESYISFDQMVSPADEQTKKEEERPQPKTQNSDCQLEKTTDSIQSKIQNGISRIDELKKSANDWTQSRILNIANIEKEITKIRVGMIEDVTSDVKELTNSIERNTIDLVNKKLKSTYAELFPKELSKVQKEVQKANNNLSCAFRNIGENLYKMVSNMISDLLGKVVNAATCFIENSIGTLLGQISGLIDTAASAALSPVKKLLNSFNIGFEIADEFTQFGTGALSLLSCHQVASCSEIKEWSPGDGLVPNATLDLNGMLFKAQEVASGIRGALSSFGDIKDKIQGAGKTFKDAVKGVSNEMSFIDVLVPECGVGPFRCGPPTIEFFGGGGSGASGNAIVSAIGTVLGVDVILPGTGYTKPPLVKFKDSCGKGGGAIGTANITPDGKVASVTMVNTGSGYIAAPDGSQGGSGRTWSEKNETIVKRSDGTYEVPYKPGRVVQVFTGDEVTQPGRVTEVITEPTEITTQEPIDTPIRGTSVNYPVVLSIESINVVNSGFGYDCSKDKIKVTPDNGAKLVISECNSSGSIIKIDVIDGGSGFKEDPEITIESNSGYNLELVPTFKVNRVEEGQQLISSTQIIQVIDCVGKF